MKSMISITCGESRIGLGGVVDPLLERRLLGEQ